MAERFFLDQPLGAYREKWNTQLIGRPTIDYEPKKAAEQLYNYIIARDQNISSLLFVLSNITTDNLRNYLSQLL